MRRPNDYLKIYECCIHPFDSKEWHDCCNVHSCCPICDELSEGIFHNPWTMGNSCYIKEYSTAYVNNLAIDIKLVIPVILKLTPLYIQGAIPMVFCTGGGVWWRASLRYAQSWSAEPRSQTPALHSSLPPFCPSIGSPPHQV